MGASTRSQRGGRLIAFEGVDGAGKTTVLSLVAERLRQAGHRVFLPREGTEHVSRPTRKIRDLTRDRRNLELRPRPELLLYCAREAQVLEELVKPALDRGETVLIDRSMLTPVVLGMARGLDRAQCERVAAEASAGLDPDTTLIFDVHPRTSRIRKRIERIRSHESREGGRKGLAGSGLKERVRDGYKAIAQERAYPVVVAERATPPELAEQVMAAIEGNPAALSATAAAATPRWMVSPELDLMAALESLPIEMALFLSNGLICARELRASAITREPELAAWGMDTEDPLREAIAEAQPHFALRGLGRKPLAGDDDLRLRLLPYAPSDCIQGLKHLDDARSDAVREEYAEREPNAVLSSLAGREDARAEALRDRCWKAGEEPARANSLAFCDGQSAWKRREKLLKKNPVVALGTLRGLQGARVDEILVHFADLAPKRVVSALGGRTDAFAHEMRDALYETGREVIDSVRGLSDEPSWELRERALSLLPSSVAHSLFGLEDDPRAQELAERCREVGAGDVHVMRRLQALAERPALPEWTRTRSALLQLESESDD